MDNIKIDTWWEIIDELRREINIKEDAIVDLNECIDDLKKDILHDSKVNEEYDDKYIDKINKLEQENKKLKKACDNLLKDCSLEQELQQSRIEN